MPRVKVVADGHTHMDADLGQWSSESMPALAKLVEQAGKPATSERWMRPAVQAIADEAGRNNSLSELAISSVTTTTDGYRTIECVMTWREPCA